MVLDDLLCERVVQRVRQGWFWGVILEQESIKNNEKTMQKSMPKTKRKNMPKVINNDGQINLKFMQNRSICWKIDFQRTTIDGVFAKYEGSASRKSVENQPKINAKSILVKVMQILSDKIKNGAKMETTSLPNQSKWKPKNDVKFDVVPERQQIKKNRTMDRPIYLFTHVPFMFLSCSLAPICIYIYIYIYRLRVP